MNIVFDLDGTLLDVSKKYYKTYFLILVELELAPLSFSDFWDYKRNAKPTTALFTDCDINNAVAYYDKRFLELIETDEMLLFDTLQDGAHDLLGPLTEKHELYLSTMRKNRKELLRELERLDLLKYFKEIINDEHPNTELPSWKRKSKQTAKFVKDGGFLIGDGGADIMAGKDLGLKTIVLLNGIRNKSTLCKYIPDMCVSDLIELRKYFIGKDILK